MYIHFLSFIFFHVSFIHSRIKILYLAYYILLLNKKIVFSDETKYTNQFGCNVSNFYRYYKVEPNLNKIILNYL